jgi:hypothetical protein
MLARSAIKPRKRNAPRPAWKVADSYRQWLRGRPCACGGKLNCGGKIVAAHVDNAGGKGMGTKVADKNCIPLSEYCHQLQHSIGWPRFEKFLPGGSGPKLSVEYWNAWPGRLEWEASQR